MKSITKLRTSKKQNKGITLIVLVITIIILLILAGVTIAALTGEKGLIKEAKTAAELTELASLEEQVELAIIKAEQKHRNPTLSNVIEELKNYKVITNDDQVTETGTIITDAGYEIKGKLDDYLGNISTGDGNTTGNNTGGGTTNPPEEPEKVKVEDVKNNGTVFDTKTEIEDNYGNKVVVPEGFKITEDSATDVTGGIVIEDVTNEATAGSQFVWIPVGQVKTANETKTIELSRYTFATDGIATKQGENTIETYFQELASSSYGNTTAKDIEGFKTSATTNHGYYIGRYEARSETERTSKSQALGQVTVKPNDYIYNYITQSKAATLARGMYASSSFTSDLMNSYAWDTAIVFIQNFGQANYSRQKSLNTSLATQGTNNLTDTTKQDKQLNIWDMASNNYEYTTETSTYRDYPCTYRGCYYNYSYYYTATRTRNPTDGGTVYYAFRLLLYM